MEKTTINLLNQASSKQQQLAGAWMALGVVALALGGIFAILLVFARTPGISAWLPVADFFKVALIVHVDLTVLIWFSSMVSVIWGLNSHDKFIFWSWLGFVFAVAGIVLMCLSAFWQPGTPIMSNYIPVLDDSLFLLGLVLFGVGLGLHLLRSLCTVLSADSLAGINKILRQGSVFSAWAALVALLAFIYAYLALPHDLTSTTYFEILFWGGGHALQFVWVILAVICWLNLLKACNHQLKLSSAFIFILMSLSLLGALISLYAYLVYGVLDPKSYLLQTQAMRWLGGVLAAPIMAYAFWLMYRKNYTYGQNGKLSGQQIPLRNALISSILLFASGGIIALFIQGSNVRIPAHYHGSIVGVTLALMGLVYYLLPNYGWRAPQSRLAKYQPLIYAFGQLMHVLGLAWSGGYGVQRKVAGSAQVLYSNTEVIAMAMMGLGGLLAVIGGALFVVVVYMSRPKPSLLNP